MTLSPRTRRNDGWVNHTAYSARMHKFGAIRSLADEAKVAGEPSLLIGTLFTAAGIATIVGVVLLIQRIM